MGKIYSEKEKRHAVNLFRSKLQELKTSIEGQSDIELINSARLIRDLLISDHNGIVGELSRIIPDPSMKKNQALVFTLKINLDTLHERVGTGGADFRTKKVIIPDTKSQPKVCNQDDFFKLPVVEIEHNLGKVIFSIRDIVKFFANKLGGVHLDYDKTGEPTDLLYDLWSNSEKAHMPNVVYTMRGIGRIVFTTCSKVDLRLKELGY